MTIKFKSIAKSENIDRTEYPDYSGEAVYKIVKEFEEKIENLEDVIKDLKRDQPQQKAVPKLIECDMWFITFFNNKKFLKEAGTGHIRFTPKGFDLIATEWDEDTIIPFIKAEHGFTGGHIEENINARCNFISSTEIVGEWKEDDNEMIFKVILPE